MFGGGIRTTDASSEPADADLRVFAYDVHRAGAFGDVALISVAGGAPDRRLRVLFPSAAAERERVDCMPSDAGRVANLAIGWYAG